MSLVRYFPTPSDRMGILWSLMTIQQSIIIEYGPAGTTHYGIGFYSALGVDQENRLFTTHMSEDDVVMGDVTRLEEAILEVDSSFHPEVIFIVASSISAVIGTDLAGVCAYMQEKTKARLIALEQGGLRGDYGLGLTQVYQQLAEAFVKQEVPQLSNTYNIIGASAYSRRARSDRNEIKRLMQEAFGFHLNACWLLDTSIEELQHTAKAQVNLCLRPEALPVCQWMQEHLGIPFVEGTPYGYAGTQSWLRAIEQTLDLPVASSLARELAEKQRHVSSMKAISFMRRERQGKAVLFGEYALIQGAGDFLEECGIPVSHRVLTQSPRVISELPENITYLESEKERLDIVRGLQDTLVLADDVMLHHCASDNHKVRASAPVLFASEMAHHLPLCGIHGADFLMEEIDAYLYPLK